MGFLRPRLPANSSPPLCHVAALQADAAGMAILLVPLEESQAGTGTWADHDSRTVSSREGAREGVGQSTVTKLLGGLAHFLRGSPPIVRATCQRRDWTARGRQPPGTLQKNE